MHCWRPTASEQYVGALQAFLARCPRALWQHIKEVPMPTHPTQCGSALQHFPCVLPYSARGPHPTTRG